MIFDDENKPEESLRKYWELLEKESFLSERVAGVSVLAWPMVKLSMVGSGTQKMPFAKFEEVICQLVEKENESGISLSKMKNLLGLDDEMGGKVLRSILEPIYGEMIAGDDTAFFLTEKGAEYLTAGGKFKHFEKGFELLLNGFDLEDIPTAMELALLRTRHGWKETEDPGLSLQKIQFHCQSQVPEVHFPEKSYFLDSVSLNSCKKSNLELPVGILQDFENETARFFVFDPKTSSILRESSSWLNDERNRSHQSMVLERFIKSLENVVPETVKDEFQLEEETALIEAQKENPGKGNSEERAKIRKEVGRFRKSFNTIEFEQELERISEKAEEEVWFISPWIRENAFATREKQIRKLLKRGVRVFIGYSASHRPGEAMIHPHTATRLEKIGLEFENLFIGELPSFHEKVVFARFEDQRFEYTGSFNVLSFAAYGKQQVGRENMRRLPWGEDSENQYQYFRTHFIDLEKRFLQNLPGFDTYPSFEKKPEVFRQRSTQLKRVANRFRLLSLNPEQVPEWGKKEDDLKNAKQKWVKAGLGALIKKWESLINHNPNQLLKEKKQLDKILNEFPDLSRDFVRADIEEARSLLSQAERASKLMDWERKLDQSEEPLSNLMQTEWRKFREVLQENSLSHKEKKILEKCTAHFNKKNPVRGLTVVGKIDLPKPSRKSKKKKRR